MQPTTETIIIAALSADATVPAEARAQALQILRSGPMIGTNPADEISEVAAAEILGISRSSLCQWRNGNLAAKSNELPPFYFRITDIGTIRYSRSGILQYLSSARKHQTTKYRRSHHPQGVPAHAQTAA